MALQFFESNVVSKCGFPAAVILQHFKYWIEKNKADERHFHDGKYWTYSSRKALTELFSYMTESQIKTAIEKLEKAGYIVKGNYNKSTYDRTVWYSITDDGYALFADMKSASAETANHQARGQESPVHWSKIANGLDTESQRTGYEKPMDWTQKANGLGVNHQPIPDNIPDNIPDREHTDRNPDNTPLTPHGGDGGKKPSKKSRKAEEPVPTAFPENPPLQSALEEWLAYKAEKRQTYASRGLNTLIKYVQDHAQRYGTEAVVALIQESMSNNWQGIAWKKLQERPRYGTRNRRQSMHVDETGHYRYNPGDTTGSF